MKHAGAVALAELVHLLAAIRKVDGLKEKKPGVFYRRSFAFLHFHEDPAGFFAHLRTDSGWQRIRVSTLKEQRTFLAKLKRSAK
jgi:hypothetical protein